MTWTASPQLPIPQIPGVWRDGEITRRILDYNEHDCRATMYVFDWLQTTHERNDMGAAAFYGGKDIRVEELPTPEAGRN